MVGLNCFVVLCFSVILISGINTSNASSLEIGSRIFGGKNVTYESQFPYIVSLRQTNGLHICSGAILSDRWIITAAQCTTGRNEDRIIIVAGSIHLSSGGTTYNVVRITNHPEYNSFTMQNDVALLGTREKIIFSRFVLPIPLGSVNVARSQTVTVTGWGQLRSGFYPDNLQYLDLSTIENSFCQSSHLGVDKQRIYDGSLCTGVVIGRGLCNGDVGSPLTLDGNLVGIVSWFIPCSRNFPDVSTRVSFHLDWIIRNTNDVIVN